MASTEPSQGTPASECSPPSFSESSLNTTRHEVSPDSSDNETEFSEEDEGTRNVDLRNRMLQEHFASGMKDIGQERGHKKAAVLLLQWEKEREGYMDTREEVHQLGEVFDGIYNFSVTERRLTRHKGPAGHQMNAHLANFILSEDTKNSLLIIYYAGHGVTRMKDDNLVLVGGNPKKGNKSLTQIVWTESEHQLDRTSADVLVIFDCCYAGILTRHTRGPFSRKIFEYIGSTPHNRTARGPGADSFTCALIWALKELATQPGGFSTSTLLQKIQNAPYFRNTDQVPVCSDRGKKPSLFKLKIEPLPGQNTAHEQQSSNSGELPDSDLLDEANLVSLQLQFIFGKCPSKAHITRLTKGLSDLVKYEHVPLKKVLWQGLDQYQKMDFPAAVARKMMFNMRRKSIARKLQLPPARYQPQRTAGSEEIIQANVDSAQHGDSDSTLVGQSAMSTSSLELPQTTIEHAGLFTTDLRAYIHVLDRSRRWYASSESHILVFIFLFLVSESVGLLRAWIK